MSVERPISPGGFATTRWSVVLAARDDDTRKSALALEILCRAYWYPLYAYARRRGQGEQEAQDLTQEFFARLLQHDWLQGVRQERGRFRTFLMMAMRRFLANEWQRAQRLKRGSGHDLLRLDTADAEARYLAEPASASAAELCFDRSWALTLLDRTMTRLETDYAAAGKASEFGVLKPCLTADREAIDLKDMATQLASSEGAVRVAVHRLRKRFRETFRDEISNTVADPTDVEGEVRHLVEVLACD